jgi:hypothetical protein
MSDHDVYRDDMARDRLSDLDVEMVLTGGIPEGPRLARLANLLQMAHEGHDLTPEPEVTARFAAEAARIATSSTAIGSPRLARPRSSASIWNRPIAATTAGFALVLGMSGVAVASDSAAPGDLLYGIDRTLESIGIGAGGATERVSEASTLLDRGQVPEAIEHVADETSADDVMSAEATAALQAAAEAVAANGQGNTSVGESVGAMLDEISRMLQDDELDGAMFGRRVSELARSIRDEADPGEGSADSEPGNQGNQGRGQGQGPPDEPPGNPDQGPKGPPDDAGGNGPPDDAGQAPDGNGNAGGKGQSEGNGPPGGGGPPAGNENSGGNGQGSGNGQGNGPPGDPPGRP